MRPLSMVFAVLFAAGCSSAPTADFTIAGAPLQLDGGVVETQRKDSLIERVTIHYPTMSAGMEGPVFAQLNEQLVGAGWTSMRSEPTSANYRLPNGYIGRAYTLDMVGIKAGISVERTFPLKGPWTGLNLTTTGAVPITSDDKGVSYAFLALKPEEAEKAHEPIRGELAAAGWVETKHTARKRANGMSLRTEYTLPDGATGVLTSNEADAYVGVEIRVRKP